MSPTLAAIIRRLNKAKDRLAAAQRTLQERLADLKRHDDQFFKTPPTEIMQHRRKVLEQGVEKATEQVDHLGKDVAQILAEEAAQFALEESLRLKQLKQGAEGLYEAVSKGKNLRYLGLLGFILFAIGISGYMIYQTQQDLDYLEGQDVSNLGQPNVPAGSPVFSNQPLSGDVMMDAEPARLVKYKLVKTKVSKQIAGEAPLETEVAGAQTSLDLSTTQPGFTSTGSLTIKVPPTIGGDQEQFTVSASLAANWNLAVTVHNLNVGLNVIGVPAHKAVGDPGPWLAAGSHSLSATQSKQTSFDTDGTVRRWTENGKQYRSFAVGGHSGVIQTLSGGTLTFIYEEE